MSLRSKLGLCAEPLYLMDGSAFVYRGFYAFQNMTRSDGFPTNALYVVARLLLRLIREERPKYFVFILDGKEKSFRHARYEQYKAQRSATPEPLVVQFEPILALLEELGVPCLVSGSFEADDYIASLAQKYSANHPVVIIGADKDLKQCLTKDVVLWDPAGKEEKITTLADFVKETGMQPTSWPDYQALIGDSSDNIPGVPKVGPKTALALMPDFPTLELLFGRLAAVPPKIRSKLEGYEELAMMCRELTRLRTDACDDISLESLEVRLPRMDKVEAFMQAYELRSLAREVASMQRVGAFGAVHADVLPQGSPSASSKVMTSNPDDATKTGDSLPLLTAMEAPASGNARAASSKKKEQELPLLALGEQANLFGEATALAPVDEVAAIQDLPVAGEFVALLPQENGMLLGSQGWQKLFVGDESALAQWLQQSSCCLVTADVKLLWHKSSAFLSIDASRWFDLALAAYLISPEERSYAWSQLLLRFGDQLENVENLVGQPALLALAMQKMLEQRLTALDLHDVYFQLELPLTSVLFAMEKRGIAIHAGTFDVFLHEVQGRLDILTQEIYGHAQRTFNIRSSQQLGDVLFSVLELPKAGKTKGGAVSTSQETLEKLQGKHPIIDCLLEYRTLEKLRSTYLEPLPRLADEAGRIHTSFNQMATATGRLSSSNPNLQNIPVRGPFGERMRSCFVAAQGNKLVCADYSQVELRVLAHLSQDPTLLEAFNNKQDIHSTTAAVLYDVSVAEVTPSQRRSAKTINFGLVYGMGAQKLGQELGVPLKEAKLFIEKYFEKLGKLKTFYDAIEQEAKENGFVSTMAGRRRLTPDINSGNAQLKSQARRQAINTRIQGSAADIIKQAMIMVEADEVLSNLQAQLILQVHDELILEVPAEHAQAAGQRLVALMEHVVEGNAKLDIKLEVDCGVGDTWAEAH